MLTNHIKIALRNFAKHKAFSLINTLGMAIGLASCILIALFVWDELKYDAYHPDGERTYRVYNETDHEGVLSSQAVVPYPFPSFMQKDFPEIEETLRLLDMYRETLLDYGDTKLLEAHGFYAEPSVFDMLTLKVVSGRASDALVKPRTVALSASLAKKYFKDKNPLGEFIKIDHRPCEVTAVFEDVPRHSHLKINFLISFASTDWAKTHETNWQRQQFYVYLKLKPGTDAIALDKKLKPFVEKYAYPTIAPKGFTYVPHLQNIADIHLHSTNFNLEIAERGNIVSVYVLSATGVMVLFIACLNFINLSTARSVKRMKEVGVRKVVGAHRVQLIFQFVTESVLVTVAGFFLAVLLAELALPFLSDTIGKPLALPYGGTFVAFGLLFCLVLGILAGSYPAFQLSRFKPALVLSKMNEAKRESAFFRQSLVTVQFMLSFFLITGSWILLAQNNFLRNKNLGFNKEQVVIVPLTASQLRNPETTKQKYSDHRNVISATVGFGLPGDIFAGDDVITPYDGKTHSTSLFCVDVDYIRTLGMKIIAGRDFSAEHKTDSSDAFVVNETALKIYGLGTPEQAVGKDLAWMRWHDGKMKKGKIIGVVEDFNFRSLREQMGPVVLHLYPKAAWKLALRIKPDHMEETIAYLRSVYQSLEPNWIFTYSFMDQSFDEMYRSEQKLGALFAIFTYLAMGVACLGLFGLVEYSVNQRTKEISIRKVFGASISSLLTLLTRQYFILLGIACVLIAPLSYLIAERWLSNFAYRVTIDWWIFGEAAMVIFAITATTVSVQSIKAALANPADNLKNE